MTKITHTLPRRPVILYRRTDAYWTATILGVSVILYIFRYSPVDLYVFNSFGQWFVFFALGVSASGLVYRIDINRTLAFALVTLAFLAGQWVFHGMLDLRVGNDVALAGLALALLGIVFVMTLSRVLMRFKCSWLAYLGRHSMEIYLIHVIAGSGVRVVLQKLLEITDIGLHLALGMLFGIGVPLLVALLAPRLGLRWLFAPPPKLLLGAAR